MPPDHDSPPPDHDSLPPGAGIARALFPAGVSVFDVTHELPDAGPWPVEAAQLQSASEKRRREFLTGRNCARLALHGLGVPACAIPIRVDRTPGWPSGIVGSITHTQGYCAAVVARSSDFMSVGVDAEEIGALSDSLWSTVLGRDEVAWLRDQEAARRVALGTLMFSAKESFYKCQHAITGSWLDFHDVRVAPGAGCFEVFLERPPAGWPVSLRGLKGYFSLTPAYVVTAFYLPHLQNDVDPAAHGTRV